MARAEPAAEPQVDAERDELAVITYAQAARRIHATERFIRRIVERGEVDYIRAGRHNVVFEASFERWIDANRVKAKR